MDYFDDKNRSEGAILLWLRNNEEEILRNYKGVNPFLVDQIARIYLSVFLRSGWGKPKKQRALINRFLELFTNYKDSSQAKYVKKLDDLVEGEIREQKKLIILNILEDMAEIKRKFKDDTINPDFETVNFSTVIEGNKMGSSKTTKSLLKNGQIKIETKEI